MKNNFAPEPLKMQMYLETKNLTEYNKISTHFGLVLSPTQINELIEHKI